MPEWYEAIETFHALRLVKHHAQESVICVWLGSQVVITRMCVLAGFSACWVFHCHPSLPFSACVHWFLNLLLLRSDAASFLETLGAVLPWTTEACFTRLLMHDANNKASFHKVDLFHTVSLGVGKAFAASSLALVQTLCNGNSVTARMSELTSLYREFCRDLWFEYIWMCFLVGLTWGFSKTVCNFLAYVASGTPQDELCAAHRSPATGVDRQCGALWGLEQGGPNNNFASVFGAFLRSSQFGVVWGWAGPFDCSFGCGIFFTIVSVQYSVRLQWLKSFTQ